MRIDDLNRATAAPAAAKSDLSSAKQTNNAHTGGSGTDHAEVSSVTQALTTTNADRLEQLRLAVQTGAYDVSPEAVANAIIDAHTRE